MFFFEVVLFFSLVKTFNHRMRKFQNSFTQVCITCAVCFQCTKVSSMICWLIWWSRVCKKKLLILEKVLNFGFKRFYAPCFQKSNFWVVKIFIITFDFCDFWFCCMYLHCNFAVMFSMYNCNVFFTCSSNGWDNK